MTTGSRHLILYAVCFGGFAISSLEAWIGPPSSQLCLSRRRGNTPISSSSSSSSPAGTFQARNNFKFLASDSNINNDSNNDKDAFGDPLLHNVPQNITALAEKKVRLAKAQADIDRILNSPVDPPFDMESELEKVVSISPPLILEGSPEYALEEQVSQMEQALYSSVKQTNFDKAAKQSQEISQMHVDDCGLVLQVNSRFYQSFSRKDIKDMRQLWLADRSCICIHPSHKPLVGIQAIQTSWDQMFESSNGSFQRSWMEPQDIRLTVKANTAVVTCEEHVFARRFIRGQKRQTELINKLQATNIFRKVGGQWFMTYHHSSWHADSDVAKQAMNKQQQTQQRRGGRGGSPSTRPRSRKGDATASPPSSEIDKILGVSNFGPILGDESKSESSSGGKPAKRIIMGSLSDILNGNLGGLLGEGLGDDDDDDDDEEEDDDDEHDDDGNSPGNGMGIDGLKKGTVIRFSRIDNGSELFDFGYGEGNDDDDDDDDADDDMDTLDQIRDFSRKDSRMKGKGKKLVSSKKSGATRRFGSNTSVLQDELRQGCISVLRMLVKEGRISPKQKRSLLSDIILCSAKGEVSMVEVAYDLLYCSPSDANSVENKESADDAQEEFAEQCIVFAQNFSDLGSSSTTQ